MDKNNKQQTNIQSGVYKKMGRKSKNDDELWNRRLKEVLYYARGIPILQIAREFNVRPSIVYNDIEAWNDLMNKMGENSIEREKMVCWEVIRDGFNRLLKQSERENDGTIPINLIGASAVYGKIIDAVRELSILKGKREVPMESNNTFNIDKFALIRQEIGNGNKEKIIQTIEETIKELENPKRG